MNAEQIKVLNTELSRHGIQSEFYSELRKNNHRWDQNCYKFLAVCNPVYAVMGAFPIDKPSFASPNTLYEFNARWISLCFEHGWTGTKLSISNADDFMYILDVMYGEGMTNAGYSPILDAKDIVCALEVLDFARSTGFISEDRSVESLSTARRIIKNALKKRAEAKKDNPGGAREAMISALDDEDHRRQEEERRAKEEEARKNEERKKKLMKISGRIVTFLNALDWSSAARETIALVNLFNELFTRKDLGMPEPEQQHEPTPEPEPEELPVEECDAQEAESPNQQAEPETQTTENSQSRAGKRLGDHRISVSVNAKNSVFRINANLGNFLSNNQYTYVSMCEIGNRLFIYFSKTPLTNGEPVQIKFMCKCYVFNSVSFAKKVLKHFGKDGDKYGIMTISDNLSKHANSRHMEIISYENK